MWRDVVEISRLKNLILASITVPLGAHIALSGEWSSDAIIQICIQTCSVIFFMASGNIVNDIYDLEIDVKHTQHVFFLLEECPYQLPKNSHLVLAYSHCSDVYWICFDSILVCRFDMGSCLLVDDFL